MVNTEKHDIKHLVTKAESIRKIISGIKTSIRRNNRYADKGDTVDLEGEIFVVGSVYQQKLGEMTELDAIAEGFPDLDAYKDSLTSIHRSIVWDPHHIVWVHELRRT